MKNIEDNKKDNKNSDIGTSENNSEINQIRTISTQRWYTKLNIVVNG